MPEPVSAPVDWISGDFSPEDSVNSAAFSARYISRQGKPWDLMSWSFVTVPTAGRSRQKPAVQLEREAAVVLAQGGGYQAYFTQERDGSVRLEELPVMAEVASSAGPGKQSVITPSRCRRLHFCIPPPRTIARATRFSRGSCPASRGRSRLFWKASNRSRL